MPTLKRAFHTCLTGIGNPEPTYRDTRHNVGLFVLDGIKDYLVGSQVRYLPCSKVSKVHAQYLTVPPDLILLRSDGSYMNVSGENVIPVWRRIESQSSSPLKHIVIHDDLEKPLGNVQLRGPGTSLRGHNGLKSIASKLGGKNTFYKLSIGIGRPLSKDPKAVSDYVLGKFITQEMDILREKSLPLALNLLGL